MLEIPSMHKFKYNIFRVYRIHVGMRIYNEIIKVYILPTLKLIFVQAVLNTVVYQMLIVKSDGREKSTKIFNFLATVEKSISFIFCS